MPLLLLLETSTNICSVALTDSNKLLGIKEIAEPNAHSAKLATFIDELFKEMHINPSQLNAVVVSAGPGSYTGLRIGVSTAKGICYALNKPLIAINTLEIFALGAKSIYPDFEGFFCPMIDARRMEVYSAVFDSNLNLIQQTQADIIESGIYDKYLDQKPVLFFGTGALKSELILKTHANARFDFSFQTSAKWMIPKAIQKYNSQLFENTAYYEPFYLKDFIAGKPSVKGLF